MFGLHLVLLLEDVQVITQLLHLHLLVGELVLSDLTLLPQFVHLLLLGVNDLLQVKVVLNLLVHYHLVRFQLFLELIKFRGQVFLLLGSLQMLSVLHIHLLFHVISLLSNLVNLDLVITLYLIHQSTSFPQLHCLILKLLHLSEPFLQCRFIE